jgi:hypothetical protein
MSVAEIGSMPSQWREGFDEDRWRPTGRFLTNEEAFQRPESRLNAFTDDRARTLGFGSASEYQDHITDSIRANGIQKPLKIQQLRGETGSGVTELGNGHHRWVAARTLGLDKVPVEY